MTQKKIKSTEKKAKLTPGQVREIDTRQTELMRQRVERSLDGIAAAFVITRPSRKQ